MYLRYVPTPLYGLWKAVVGGKTMAPQSSEGPVY